MRKRWLGVGLLVAMAAVVGVPRLPDGLSPPADRPAVDQAEADRVTLDVNELIARRPAKARCTRRRPGERALSVSASGRKRTEGAKRWST